MENDKSPGIDGIPIELSKTFYHTIENDLLKIYNNILFYEQNITKTMHQALITLIPKRGFKPAEILTKILSDRLKNILPHIISEEQNCSFPQRPIFNNLFLIRDIIKFSKEKNIKLYLLQIDQEKAFDKVDHDFLYKTMEKIGLCNTFIKFIQILYNTSIIINNGFLSSLIHLQRGLRQGCPLSLPLYVIQGEVTTINVNQNKNINRIKIPNKTNEIKMSQYADDSNFLLREQESVAKVIKHFQNLKRASGATINLEQTKLLPINTDKTNYIQNQLPNITTLEYHQYLQILRVHFSENLKGTIILN